MVHLVAAFAIKSQALQLPPAIYVLDEIAGEVPPAMASKPATEKLIYTCDVRIIGRRNKVVLDTHARALPYSIQDTPFPKTLLEVGVHGLGRHATRVVCEPEVGTVAWITVLNVRRVSL